MGANVAHYVTYCVECEWAANTENYTRSEQSDLAIDHYVATGHPIESERRVDEEPAAGWANDWPPTEHHPE